MQKNIDKSQMSDSTGPHSAEGEERPVSPGTGRGHSWPGVILAFLAVIYSLYFGRPFLIPILLAIYFWMVLRPIVRVLHKRLKLPLPLAAGVLLGLLLGGLIAGVSVLEAPAEQWLKEAPLTFQQMDKKLTFIKQQVQTLIKTKHKLEDMTALNLETTGAPMAIRPESIGSRLITGTQSFLISFFTMIILIFFLLASGDLFLLKLVRLSSGLRNKIRAVEAAHTIEQEIGRYLIAISIINSSLGLVTGMVMWVFGMPNPLLWGVMVALFNYVPYVGPTVSVLTLGGVALMVMPSLGQALLIPSVFILIIVIEGQLLQPLILARHFSINPVLIFLSLLFWGWIWGVIGLLIAVPVLVVLKIICSHVEGLGFISEFLAD